MVCDAMPNSLNSRNSTEVIPERRDKANDRLARFIPVHFDGLHPCFSSVKQGVAWGVFQSSPEGRHSCRLDATRGDRNVALPVHGVEVRLRHF